MGKDTDKMYITHSEWSTLDFGAGGFKNRKTGKEFKRLPYYCCALSLSPFDVPRCTKDGLIFDLMHILPWIKKHGTNPVTGEPLAAKDLIPLHFHKNADGAYHDPITFKVFTDSTHIVAVATTGHVYAYETINELIIKTKSWKDLMTDEPFKRKDLITIQDPHNVSNRDINAFHYKVNDVAKPDSTVVDPAALKKKEIESTINATGSTARILAAMAPAITKSSAPITPSFVTKEKSSYNAAHYSDNSAAASFTSLGATAITKNKSAVISDDEYLVANVKDHASARIHTNFGFIDVELFCDVAPKACYNFVKLAKNGYYKNVPFHRSIKHFMIQTGDPTGTGRGGQSYYGHTFADEFKGLSHNERGILSMANRGKDTNSSQFFITYKQCKHLDNKHSIFGKITAGHSVLDRMESVETDSSTDKPKTPITMNSIEILVDPFEKQLNVLKGTDPETLQKQQEAEARRLKKEANDRVFAPRTGGGSSEIGKYFKNSGEEGGAGSSGSSAAAKRTADGFLGEYENAERPTKKKAAGGGAKFDFSSW
ncbi:UNVERIFIED_CONTAM: Peptidyl-prolyl cis-trans isomerase cyp8 [Siphonaria sp. JEL0065]|nr:Peptidyl-prolyl cis-trans isomerase cyp8 [Siphonaria sp. JEL0065]